MNNDLEKSVNAQLDARIYKPIVAACLQDERDRAVELLLNAAEGLHLADPRQHPTLADGLATCKAVMMSLALRMDAGRYQKVTEVLGLAQSLPTPSFQDRGMKAAIQLLGPSIVDPV